MLVYLRWKTPKSLNPKYRDHDANLSRWHVAACDVTTGQWRTACGLDPRAGHLTMLKWHAAAILSRFTANVSS